MKTLTNLSHQLESVRKWEWAVNEIEYIQSLYLITLRRLAYKTPLSLQLCRIDCLNKLFFWISSELWCSSSKDGVFIVDLSSGYWGCEEVDWMLPSWSSGIITLKIRSEARNNEGWSVTGRWNASSWIIVVKKTMRKPRIELEWASHFDYEAHM